MESLGLDIKLLVAQIINFAILFFVLKKLLYKPLIKLLDERNKKIGSALENSQKIEEKLAKIEEKEHELLEKARQRAKSERNELLAAAASEKEGILDEAKKAANKEIEKGLEAIKAAEAEAIKVISDKYINEIAETLGKKMATDAKKKGFPAIKKLVK